MFEWIASAKARYGLPMMIFLSVWVACSGTARAQVADDVYAPDADDSVRAIAIDAQGRALIGGSFTTVGGFTRSGLARLNVDGTVDAGSNGFIRSITLQIDGGILVGGFFTEIAGQARASLARINPDGSLDAGFDAGSSPGWSARLVVPELDGDIVIDSTGDGVLELGTLAVTGMHAADFTLDNDQCSGQTLPDGDFCGFEIRFAPTAAGVRSAEVDIPSNVPGGSHTVTVTGTSDMVFIDGFES